MRWRRRSLPLREPVLLDEYGRAAFLARHMGEAIIVADANNRIYFFSPEAEALFGWTATEIEGKHLAVIQPERYRQAHLNGFDRIRREGLLNPSRVLFEDSLVEGLCKDGSEIPLAISTAAWRTWGGDLYFVATLRIREETS